MRNNSVYLHTNGLNMSPMKLQSATIDLLRFPLAIMVIFIHMNPDVINLVDADFNLMSWHGLYNVTGILLSHVLTHIAVPTFFFISGFLFFVNFQEWSWDNYERKIHSRVRTLIIPYIVWNIVPFLLLVLTMLWGAIYHDYPIDNIKCLISENSWHIFYDSNVWGTDRVNWLGENLKMTGPYDSPLWFLRDLIVVTILTPIIYIAIKKLNLFIIAFLFVAYISRIWTLLPGFHITAFFYFTTGAYFALNRINIVQFVNNYKKYYLPVCAILLIITIIYDGTNTIIGQNIYPIFICTGVLSAFYIASVCIKRYNFKANKLLLSSCFFIYAIHGVGLPIINSPLSFTQQMLRQLIPGNTNTEVGICYMLTPFITAFLCIFVLQVGRRIFPRTTLLFSGNK